MVQKSNKVLVISGGSSGIGLATATLFYQKGYTVYELSRSGTSKEGINHIDCDVTSENIVNASIDQVIEKEGKIDLLISNAGFGISGPIEFTSTEDAKRLFDVNFFGSLNIAKAVTKQMRLQGFGKIIFTSSVAGVLSIPFQSFYSASKAAINSLTLALANEVRPFNISVCALMPGDVSTGFTASRQKSVAGSDVYSKLEKSIATMEKDELGGMSSMYIAKCFFKISCKKRVKPLYTGGLKYKLFIFLAKILPTRFCNYIVCKLY